MMTELFASGISTFWAVWTLWAARAVPLFGAARIAFSRQTIKLTPAMTKFRQVLLPLVLTAAAGFAPLAMANARPGAIVRGSAAQEAPVQAAMFRDGISLDEAVSRAERQYRARVVRTEVQDEDGRTVYVLKLLSENGRVFTVRIDAATGRMR
jgi:hypothetical protein